MGIKKKKKRTHYISHIKALMVARLQGRSLSELCLIVFMSFYRPLSFYVTYLLELVYNQNYDGDDAI